MSESVTVEPNATRRGGVWSDEDYAEHQAAVEAQRAARGYVPTPAEELEWGPVETLPNGVRIQKQVRRKPACN